jgi:PEP-CTERM motif
MRSMTLATVTSVPEPGTLALLTFGLLGVGAIARRRSTSPRETRERYHLSWVCPTKGGPCSRGPASRTVRPKTTDQGVIQSLTGSSFGPSGLAKRTT